MATTTTNFGWDIPQSTDLVKDGATAIAALGQDIDTALVDLKGGTTGQVLAKASGTDLDFTWVAQDDSNAIQNAIVDAKGDLIAATSADTPARLAVGTNGQYLTADSTAATGLAWTTPSGGGGLVHINTTTFTNVSSQSINSVFSSTYKTYRVIIRLEDANSTFSMKLRASGTDKSADYSYAIYGWDSGSSGVNSNYNWYNGTATSSMVLMPTYINEGGTAATIISLDINQPFASGLNTVLTGTAGYNRTNPNPMVNAFIAAKLEVTGSYDGFTLIGGDSSTTGSVSIYGYKES